MTQKALTSQGRALASLSGSAVVQGPRGDTAGSATPPIVALLAVAGGSLFLSVGAVLAAILLYFALAATVGR